MTPQGWVFMLCSWLFIAGLMIFSYSRIFSVKEKKSSSSSKTSASSAGKMTGN